MENTTNPLGYKIVWLGWNEKENYDRIWGYLKMDDDRHYAFWGKRNGRQQFKPQQEWRIGMLVSQQENKGYKKIDPSHYEEIAPGFQESVEIWLMTNILADTFR